VQKELADWRVIVMDLRSAHEEVVQFVNAGVAVFILKDATLEDFVETVRGDSGRAGAAGALFCPIARLGWSAARRKRTRRCA